MTNPLPVPADTNTDAKNRALRTFVQGLLADAVIAAVTTLGAALVDPHFVLSRVYLTGVGLLLAKTVLTSVVSYIARYAKPPATT
jgi:hypothetical protein